MFRSTMCLSAFVFLAFVLPAYGEDDAPVISTDLRISSPRIIRGRIQVADPGMGGSRIAVEDDLGLGGRTLAGALTIRLDPTPDDSIKGWFELAKWEDRSVLDRDILFNGWKLPAGQKMENLLDRREASLSYERRFLGTRGDGFSLIAGAGIFYSEQHVVLRTMDPALSESGSKEERDNGLAAFVSARVEWAFLPRFVASLEVSQSIPIRIYKYFLDRTDLGLEICWRPIRYLAVKAGWRILRHNLVFEGVESDADDIRNEYFIVTDEPWLAVEVGF